MLFDTTYNIIERPSESSFKDRGSKFLAYAYPIQSETQVKIFLEALKKEHINAVHFCYAYRLGENKSLYRMNDDGEPSGSAGKPIYNVILSHDLTNCLIVVVRYFGGTLLGVPGLIHAYKTAAMEAIANNEIVEKAILHAYLLKFNYEHQSTVSKMLKESAAEKIEYGFEGILPTVKFSIKKSMLNQFDLQMKALYQTELKTL